MRTLTILVLIILVSLLLTSCPGKAPESTEPEEQPVEPVTVVEETQPVLVVGSIVGPTLIYADSPESFEISAGGDSGIRHQWSCIPPDLGAFDNPASASPLFNAARVVEETDIQISVETSSDNFDAVERSIDVAIHPALDGWLRKWGRRSVGGMTGIGVDGAGNVYVVGGYHRVCDFDPGFDTAEREAVGGADIFLCKFDPLGEFQWVQTWGGRSTESPRGLAVDSYGNSYVAGHFQRTVDFDPGEDVVERTSTSLADAFLCKFNSGGEFQWVRTWGDSGSTIEVASIAIDPSSNVFVTGGYMGTIDLDPGDGIVQTASKGGADTFLSKFTSSGRLAWARVWGGDVPNDQCTGGPVAVDRLGHAYVGGMFSGKFMFSVAGASIEEHFAGFRSSGGADAYLCKVDSGGRFQWCRVWGGPGLDHSWAVSARGGSGVYVTGGFEQTADFDPGTGVNEIVAQSDGDAFLMRFTAGGSLQWVRTWIDAVGMALTSDSSGNALVVGSADGSIDFDPGEGREMRYGYVYLAQYDPSGDFVWANSWGSADGEMGVGVVTDGNGNILTTGMFRGTVWCTPGSGFVSQPSAGDPGAFIIKFLPDGTW